MPENELILRRDLESQSSDQLRAILHAETEKEIPDDELVLVILHILEDREPDELAPVSAKEEAAYKLFRKRVQDRKRKHNLVWKRLANAAVLLMVVGLLFAVIPQEVEADSLWDVLVRWTQNAVEYFSPEENKKESPFVFKTDNPGMQQIYDAAVEMGIKQPLVPMWFPEGYVLDSITSVDMSKEKYFIAQLLDGFDEAVIQVRLADERVLHGYFGEEDWHQAFEREGAEYKVMRNINRWTAVWTIEKSNTPFR